jgi:hypothetical protein
MSARLESWIAAYQKAWESNEPDDIRGLFTDDAEYRTEPYSEPWTGHQEIVDGWLEGADEPGDWTFEWSPLVENDDLSIITATTDYDDAPTYSNLWVIRFSDDGRARSFTEWWMDPGDKSS